MTVAKPRTRLAAWCAILSVLCITVPLRGAGPAVIGAGSLADESLQAGRPATHAWVVVPEFGSPGAAVLHLPPRGAIGVPGAAPSPRAGEVRVAGVLVNTPVAVAARGSRLAMVFGDTATGFPLQHGRTVLSLGANLGPGGLWESVPQQGRLDALPSLRGDGLLLGFAGAEPGFAALFHEATSATAASRPLSLIVLQNDEWLPVALPEDLQAMAFSSLLPGSAGKVSSTAQWRLFATPGGVGLFVIHADHANGRAGTCFTAAFPEAAEGTSVVPVWTRSEIEHLPIEGAGRVEIFVSGGHTVIIVPSADAHLHVFTQPLQRREMPWREVANVAPGAPDYCVVPLDGTGRFAVVSAARPRLDAAGVRQMVTEVSARTGMVFYSGDVALTSPISRSDKRMIWVILAYAIGLVLIFLVKGPGGDAVLLPDGLSIAEPGRRVLAGLIDAAIALLIASRAWQLPLADLVTPGVWWPNIGPDVTLLACGVAIAMGTLMEYFFGRSVGKMLTGCEVVRVRLGGLEKPEDADPTFVAKPPTLGGAALRNFIKWGLPPVALLGLLDITGRHRGDHLAQTAVVVEGEEEQEGGEGSADV